MIFQWLKRAGKTRPLSLRQNIGRNRATSSRPGLELLEDRLVPTTFVVDSILDGNDGDFSAGNFSLREAISQANSTAGADEITFSSALSGRSLSLTQGELSILESLTINGDLNNDSSPDITINANQQSRIFNIDDGNRTPNQTVQLNGLTLTGGRVADDGGAILNRENLTILNSILTNNSTTGRNNDGGAISNRNGSLTLIQSIVSNNSTSGDNSEGGGIYNVTGTVTLNRSTLSNNSTTVANSEGGGVFTVNGNLIVLESTVSGNSTLGNNGEGGGIFNQNSSLTIRQSTISNNFTRGAGSEGGGIYTDTELRTLIGVISNATISGNSSSADGGGIYNFDGLLQIRNSTITNNSAAGLAGGVASFGDANTTTQVVSTIIAGNTTTDVDLVQGTINSFLSLGTNLVGVGSSTTAFNQTTDQTGVTNPGLSPLGNNGGPVQTHALQATSPALNAGSNPDNLTTDQRGADRAFGNTDIGAYESLETVVVDTLEDTVDNDFSEGDRSFREALLYIADGGTITFADSLAGQSITLNGNELAITKSLTLDGDLDNNGSPDITLNANQQSRIFNVNDRSGARQTVNLEGLILTGGNIADDGGAIFNRENLTVSNSILTNNSTRGVNSDGGGIFNNGGNLTVISSSLSGNSTSGAGSDGGAIYSQNGNVEITLSSLTNNSTAGLNSEGGAIFNSSGSLTVSFSTIDGNSTTGRNSEGGGIYTQEAALRVSFSTISNNFTNGLGSEGGGIYSDTDTNNPIGIISSSTISGNSARADGGGIYNFDGLLQIRNSTITDNTTTGLGGGVASFGDGVTFTHVISSIIAGNSVSDVDFVLLNTNSFLSQGFNLIGTGNAIEAFTEIGDLVGVIDPGLEPLAENGGPARTHALSSDSPAVNAGSNPDNLTTDQRGNGFPRSALGQTDIGAFEVQPIVIPSTPVALAAVPDMAPVVIVNNVAAPPPTPVVALEPELAIRLVNFQNGDLFQAPRTENTPSFSASPFSNGMPTPTGIGGDSPATQSGGAPTEDDPGSEGAPIITEQLSDATFSDMGEPKESISVTGSFADSTVEDLHMLLIEWGDGESSRITLEQDSRTFEASHHYTRGGVYTISVTVMDRSGASDTRTSTAVVTGYRLTETGELQIVQSNGSLKVGLKQPQAVEGAILVETKGEGGEVSHAQFHSSKVNRIVVHTSSGKDRIHVDERVGIKTVVQQHR